MILLRIEGLILNIIRARLLSGGHLPIKSLRIQFLEKTPFLAHQGLRIP